MSKEGDKNNAIGCLVLIVLVIIIGIFSYKCANTPVEKSPETLAYDATFAKVYQSMRDPDSLKLHEKKQDTLSDGNIETVLIVSGTNAFNARVRHTVRSVYSVEMEKLIEYEELE